MLNTGGGAPIRMLKASSMWLLALFDAFGTLNTLCRISFHSMDATSAYFVYVFAAPFIWCRLASAGAVYNVPAFAQVQRKLGIHGRDQFLCDQPSPTLLDLAFCGQFETWLI